MDTENAVSEKKEAKERQQWGNQLEFFFTLVAYAVGLGNVWRFPYLAYKSGGGAFFIPYILMLVFVGMPMFFMEISFGQYCSLGPITAWKVSPLFKGLGMASVCVSGMIGYYYNVIIAYSFHFFFASMTSEVPWALCNNTWNSDHCVENISQIEENVTQYTPAEEYFYFKVLNITSGIDEAGGLNWELVGTLALAWVIVFLALIKGVGSLGKVVYPVAIFPYVMLTILLIRGATLEGAKDGVVYYVNPVWDRLGDFDVWKDAAVQIFYSLSACSGGLIAMASFNKFNHNVRRDAILIPIINCATSIYAGFAVFCVLGFMAYEKNMDVEDVAEQGPGLVFVVYPEALARMPLPPLWSILFFAMMIMLGFGSQLSIMECVMASIIDEFPRQLHSSTLRNIIFRFCVCLVWFLLGLVMVTHGGQYVVNLVDESVGGYPLLFVGLFELLALMWVYGFHKFAEDIFQMIGWRVSLWWQICWRFLAPLLLFAVLITSLVQYGPVTYSNPIVEGGTYEYPDWCIAVEWIIVSIPLLFIFVTFMYKFCQAGAIEVLKDAARPAWDWGPAETRKKMLATTESTASFKQKPDDVSIVPHGYATEDIKLTEKPAQNSANNSERTQGKVNLAFEH